MKSTFSKILCVLCLAGLLMFFFGTGVNNIDVADSSKQLCIAECGWVLQ